MISVCELMAHANQSGGKKIRRGNHMAHQPVPSSQNQHIMILIEEHLTVETYLQLFANGCPEHLRPQVCPHCLIQVMLHRHGKYNRHAYTPEDQSHIPIYRFICPNPNCRKTTALLPAFLKEHHPISFDIQEKVIRQQAKGKTLVQLSGELLRHLGEETPFSITKAKRLFDEALMARTAQGGKELVRN
ncbi:hypothetical protein [Desulforamulus reducens]|nr:hypothetical protein [Desulforamulus reducens]